MIGNCASAISSACVRVEGIATVYHRSIRSVFEKREDGQKLTKWLSHRPVNNGLPAKVRRVQLVQRWFLPEAGSLNNRDFRPYFWLYRHFIAQNKAFHDSPSLPVLPHSFRGPGLSSRDCLYGL